MKKFILLSLLLFASIISASETKTPQKIMSAFKIERATILVDGKLDEVVWKKIPIDEFTQKDPKEGSPATQRTEVWIAYDEEYLYVAAKLYDTNPELIDIALSRRDNYFTSDWFGFYVDPFNDKKTGNFFGINAAGTMVDGVLFNDSWDDSSWDGVWEGKTTINGEGWSLEMRIPFSQLRFKESDKMVWGINFNREIKRNGESSYYVMVPKKESGFVSRFASLEGLNGIKPKQRLEILPYIVQKAQYLVHDKNDPFYKSNQYKTTIGADFKIGLSSSLNIDATINPDFGQVEVDPAVINLSAFESYFEEKRPFFIEGSNSFYFGIGGANNNWGFNFSWPELFYSRRIGRSPQGPTSSADYVRYPTETNILGAAKLTGKLDDVTTLGAVSAVTERTFVTLYNNGFQTTEQVEPLTHYGILRTKREFNDGRQSLGFMMTTVNRQLNTASLESRLAKNAFTFGLDGYTFLDEDKVYVLSGALAGSYIHGTEKFVQRLQKRPYRYFQRPDATYMPYDSTLTSLEGWYGRVTLNKQQGNFYINAALGAASPGFEHNDLGFQWMADRINSHLVLGYRWFEPDGVFRNKSVYLAHARSYNFEGNLIQNFIWLRSNLQFENYWQLGVNGFYAFEAMNPSATRGGPLIKNPEGYSLAADVTTDSRKQIIFETSISYERDLLKGEATSFGFNVQWKPNSQIDFTVGPQYQINNDTRQWVGNFADVSATNTYGTRYVFANIDQKTLSANIRLNWTFTPTLSLQLFLQPLLAVGNYYNYKEIAKPKTLDLNEYGKNGSTIVYDNTSGEYIIDPDGASSAKSFSVGNPNFNFKSLRGNAVLRWEAMPGSILYFVWSHDQQNYDDAGEFIFGRDLRNLWKSEGNDVFMVKFSYWLDM
ncbi:MAG: hypothetical protein A2499_14195 [Stygiobacter sp. RIFOXYC12_FULL_38_8]|nr:MAG: hypothetical protein A2X62_01710 [Stygiobacter sp. GWC2_38_9]OGU84420.1 MAG: hypothetical protein A2279_06465 [Stygiobacter sp. RIFOXYA12_FULL_38_9]OGV07730.1 MAG: hypothetical protein A2299_06115 [Stygiobacter sp. RIFOXYB2_FULL_37_11]OGV12733.1 MAG: hypothetical protein A2440_15950 [Stygiobacter sp. RIFOXYC2_FULL_38_25]OGV17615.1 MAG: hypothetical protein A2237_17350 [Stygiobacter sp. RIFOXYA2_FULL_38_8]OGV26991.1 MAG: hypothetical protein A2499_14195 [Stygiobacter sp. RIFOXYC12_FULL_